MLHKLWKYVRKSTEKFKQIRKICYNSSDKSVWLESGVWLFLERMTRAVSINKGGLIESRLFGKLPVAEELFVRFVSQHSLPPTVPTISNLPSGNGMKKSKENSDCFLKLEHISWIHFKVAFSLINFGSKYFTCQMRVALAWLCWWLFIFNVW